MFAESRSSRPKVNLYLSVKSHKSLIDLADYPNKRLSSPQLKISQWEVLLYRTLILSWQLSASSQPQGIKKLFKLFSYSLIFLLAVFRQPNSVSAQSFEPLTPDRPQPRQPQPLPPRSNPLNESLNAPPVPESVLDIPGSIAVEQFQFAGNTVFSQAELKAAIANFTGQPISFAQLIQAANAITELYVARGYITSGAYVPEQNLDSGVVQIQIIEGSLAEIEVNVVKGRLDEDYIRNRLKRKTQTPLNINQLQEALQLLQLNPLIASLDAELSAGIEPGTNTLAVSVTGADTFSLQARLNNNRNPSIGTFERGIELREANLFGIGDGIRFAYYNTDGSNQYEGGYILPLNSRDGSLSFDFRIAKNQIVEPPFDDADIDINSRNYDLTWRQPILQKATPEVTQELALSLTASRRESDTSILDVPEALSPGANEDGEIRTSVLSLGQEWLQRNRKQVISARSQFNFGLNAFNATTSEEEPDSQFFAWRGQLSYLRLLSTPEGNPAIGSTILLRSQLQLAADPLIPTEQFSLGGATTVRGYRQDVLLTDNGFSAAAELRLPIAHFDKINTSLQFSPFIDFGTGWNADGESTEFSTLMGTGFGLLLVTEDRLSARIDWGIPLINHDLEDRTWQENGVYLQLDFSIF
ncbi:ShlB/FhaC/HecB family hemolysin secretion/activation protein [Pleurocapsa sp. PCC 7319]|uniref:ShlB/FhaC/HecB family hemolysin secretion/activation protein n=1 Tax=Pleurocapsa sp. PCC 7319 TaxID=118161 RepID=UPI0003600DB9|nr:ShlB/FhaC/HecB family hemolysin secretion/activation protein [Pleurocapsa sp. PCC 7319]